MGRFITHVIRYAEQAAECQICRTHVVPGSPCLTTVRPGVPERPAKTYFFLFLWENVGRNETAFPNRIVVRRHRTVGRGRRSRLRWRSTSGPFAGAAGS